MIRIALLSVIFSIVSCGSGSQDKISQNNPRQKVPGSEVSSTIQDYRVVESFNVGKNVVVRALSSDERSQSLWVGTAVGVLEVDLQSGDVRRTFTRDNGLANEYVFAAVVDSRGDTWFGTNGGGMSRLSGDKWKTFFPLHGLGDYWVYSFADQENIAMWIGTWAGLSRYDYKTGEFKTYVKELVNEWVYGLDLDSQNRLWVGTEGGVNMFDGKTWSTWTHKQGLGAANENNLPFSENTGLGTRSRHDLSVLAKGKDTYNPNYVFCITVDNNDTVWAGTWGGGVSYYRDQRWHNFTTHDGLAGNIVYSMTEQGNGIMWFGTNKGLSQYDGKNWRTFTRDDGLLDNHVYAVTVSEDNKVWVGTKHGVALLSVVE